MSLRIWLCKTNKGRGITHFYYTDVDECSSGVHTCNLSESNCIDTEGSYWCNQTISRKWPRQHLASDSVLCILQQIDGGSENQSIPIEDALDRVCVTDGTIPTETGPGKLTTTLSDSGIYKVYNNLLLYYTMSTKKCIVEIRLYSCHRSK
jgi:hypothetical protein